MAAVSDQHIALVESQPEIAILVEIIEKCNKYHISYCIYYIIFIYMHTKTIIINNTSRTIHDKIILMAKDIKLINYI